MSGQDELAAVAATLPGFRPTPWWWQPAPDWTGATGNPVDLAAAEARPSTSGRTLCVAAADDRRRLCRTGRCRVPREQVHAERFRPALPRSPLNPHVARVKQSCAVKTFEGTVRRTGERSRTRPAGSGHRRRPDAGVHTIGKKILEEAGEVWMAAEHEPTRRCGEISQLLY